MLSHYYYYINYDSLFFTLFNFLIRFHRHSVKIDSLNAIPVSICESVTCGC